MSKVYQGIKTAIEETSEPIAAKDLIKIEEFVQRTHSDYPLTRAKRLVSKLNTYKALIYRSCKSDYKQTKTNFIEGGSMLRRGLNPSRNTGLRHHNKTYNKCMGAIKKIREAGEDGRLNTHFDFSSRQALARNINTFKKVLTNPSSVSDEKTGTVSKGELLNAMTTDCRRSCEQLMRDITNDSDSLDEKKEKLTGYGQNLAYLRRELVKSYSLAIENDKSIQMHFKELISQDLNDDDFNTRIRTIAANCENNKDIHTILATLRYVQAAEKMVCDLLKHEVGDMNDFLNKHSDLATGKAVGLEELQNDSIAYYLQRAAANTADSSLYMTVRTVINATIRENSHIYLNNEAIYELLNIKCYNKLFPPFTNQDIEGLLPPLRLPKAEYRTHIQRRDGLDFTPAQVERGVRIEQNSGDENMALRELFPSQATEDIEYVDYCLTESHRNEYGGSYTVWTPMKENEENQRVPDTDEPLEVLAQGTRTSDQELASYNAFGMGKVKTAYSEKTFTGTTGIVADMYYQPGKMATKELEDGLMKKMAQWQGRKINISGHSLGGGFVEKFAVTAAKRAVIDSSTDVNEYQDTFRKMNFYALSPVGNEYKNNKQYYQAINTVYTQQYHKEIEKLVKKQDIESELSEKLKDRDLADILRTKYSIYDLKKFYSEKGTLRKYVESAKNELERELRFKYKTKNDKEVTFSEKIALYLGSENSSPITKDKINKYMLTLAPLWYEDIDEKALGASFKDKVLNREKLKKIADKFFDEDAELQKIPLQEENIEKWGRLINYIDTLEQCADKAASACPHLETWATGFDPVPALHSHIGLPHSLSESLFIAPRMRYNMPTWQIQTTDPMADKLPEAASLRPNHSRAGITYALRNPLGAIRASLKYREGKVKGKLIRFTTGPLWKLASPVRLLAKHVVKLKEGAIHDTNQRTIDLLTNSEVSLAKAHHYSCSESQFL
ncbi:hypothetical protein SG34_032310 [Thalassomonas viridans]|uniref:Uncharacterized protein n=1 Tax=Thalassomonas viridans TaxID=137584 RepID=A0AAE9Z8A7_9GAMM|nr:hypothetical protein [Thalassomonas viridans]WDE08605.1 hypothetical protein SG34_032310 [Thalassomonas viridans]